MAGPVPWMRLGLVLLEVQAVGAVGVYSTMGAMGPWISSSMSSSTWSAGGTGLSAGFWFGGAFGAVEQSGDDLEVEEHAAGADGVEVVGGDAAEDLRGDGEGRGVVFDDGEFEGLVGVEVAEFAGFGFGGRVVWWK